MLRRRYRDRISLVEFINCVMASGARLPVQIEKNPLYASHAALPVRVAFVSHSLFLRPSPYSLLPPFFTLSSRLFVFSALLATFVVPDEPKERRYRRSPSRWILAPLAVN